MISLGHVNWCLITTEVRSRVEDALDAHSLGHAHSGKHFGDDALVRIVGKELKRNENLDIV